jgi:erlin
MKIIMTMKIILSIIVSLALFSSSDAFFPIHRCEQGHRCVYYRGGSLLSHLTDPGYQLKIPLITFHHNVQVTWQTDTLNHVVCGSSQGGQAYLDIDVVNKLSNSDYCIIKVVGEHTVNYDKPLIFDYIPSEVAQFCKNYTLDDIVIREFDKLDEVLLEKLRDNIESYGLSDCLEIKKVRINRPQLDTDMRKKFESIENEQKAKELAIHQKETERVRLEIQLQKELMEKDRQKKTNEIEMEIQLAKAKSLSENKHIQDQMDLHTKQMEAEAELFRLEKMATGYSRLFENPDYIRLEALKTAYNNAKIVIGDIPKTSIFNFDNMEPSKIAVAKAYDMFETGNKTHYNE